MLEFDIIQSGLIIALLFVVGEFASRKMKALLPAVLVSGLIYMALFWAGILPGDLVERSKLDVLLPMGMMFIILSMGCNTSLKEMIANWRVVLLAALSYFFQLGMVMLVIYLIYGRNLAIAAIPGGSAVALIVQEQARALGYNDCIILSVLLLFMNSMVACPIVGQLIKKEARRLIDIGIPSGDLSSRTLPQSPAKEKKETSSTYVSFLKFYAGAWIAGRISILTGINMYVLCLILGVIFSELGFFRKDEFDRTKSGGLLFFIMLAMILKGFAASTPSMLLSMLLPIVIVIVTGVLSITLASSLLGRILGFSPWLSVALGFNIMVGFPVNLMISQDMIGYLTDDKEEQAYLMEKIGNRMVLAGFTSTTFLSNIMGGLLVGLMR